MKIQTESDRVRITEIGPLEGELARAFVEEVSEALPRQLKTIEIDLSGTTTLDNGGLSALVAIYKQASRGNSELALRILNPTPQIQQLFELTRMHQLFEIVPLPPSSDATA